MKQEGNMCTVIVMGLLTGIVLGMIIINFIGLNARGEINWHCPMGWTTAEGTRTCCNGSFCK